jgi:Family of unknown function (DUF6188)
MDLELDGQQVTGQEAEFSLTLRTDRGSELQIETAYSVRTAGEIVSITPGESDPPSLVDEKIKTATASDSGQLEVVFESGVVLRVEPDPDFEAWTFVAPDGKRVVSMAEGELAVWSAQ